MARVAPRAVPLPASMERGDIARVVDACLASGRASAAIPRDAIHCDAADTVEPALPVVDAIARVALGARRSRREFRLEHAPPALLDLLDLCGLRELIASGRRDSG